MLILLLGTVSLAGAFYHGEPGDELLSFLPPVDPQLAATFYDGPKNSRYGQPKVSAAEVNVSAPAPPCCADTISSIACRRLYSHNTAKFLHRCEFDADFSLIQCCNTCGLETADKRYAKFFDKNQASQHCYDRHGAEFCMRFLRRADVWGASSWSCDGQFATLAFRICRRTCGFCQKDIYNTSKGRLAVTPCGRTPKVVAESLFHN